jgi:hypothetical protein
VVDVVLIVALQIQSKKIHIGNDIVVLFFLDGAGSVSLDSIVSQFNHVYIIISKVPDKYRKMYRVTVASKKGVGQTAPTITGGSIFEKTPEFRKLLLTKSKFFRLRNERLKLIILQQ